MSRMSYKKAAIIYRQKGPNLPLCKDFAEVWNGSEFLSQSPAPEDWDRTVTIWGHFGLIKEDFEDFAASIERRGDDLPAVDRWKYLCGCAWNMVRIVKEIAEEGDMSEPEGNDVGDGGRASK